MQEKMKMILQKDENLVHIQQQYSVSFYKTRANTGHAVLQSTPKPPKMRRCNGLTDRRTDGWTDGLTDPLIEVLCST